MLLRYKISLLLKTGYVISSDNPADYVSHGIDPRSLKYLDHWWSGPVWLHDDSSDYESTASYDLENVPEAKKSQVVSLVIETTNAEILLMYSSFKRTCRVFCYVFRFLNNSRCSKENKCTGRLMAEEYHQTTLKIVRVIQHKKYKADIDDLMKDSAINNSLKLKNLHPFLNSDELLRVGGRLMNVDIT
jgi:hypothetical protein